MNLPPRLWELGDYVRIWRNGYEYGHIETIEGKNWIADTWNVPKDGQVMLVGDDGKEIYTTVKELEAG